MDIKKAEKSLNIKTNVLKRILKEYEYYLKEVAGSEKYIGELIAKEGIDSYDIKKAREVLQENHSMSQNTLDRIETSRVNLIEELKVFESIYKPEGDDSETPQRILINQAREYLEKAENLKK
uniref:Tubulin-specific chaperone A n=1 Tax=Parastrongyloides trichosuri TaxID=131310 RepID=A0A0N4ZVJ6_PARTI